MAGLTDRYLEEVALVRTEILGERREESEDAGYRQLSAVDFSHIQLLCYAEKKKHFPQ